MFGGYVKKPYLCTRNRERCGSDWNTESEVRFFKPLKKNFLKNFFEKVWWLEIKSLPLHPLSKTIAIKKSSLKDLDMNKQVVQFLLK